MEESQGWIMHEVDRDVRVEVRSVMPEIDGDLDGIVEQLWVGAQVRLAGALFNGRIFCADRIGPGLIEGHWTEFRRLVAQFERPALYERLRLRSLAVSGILICPDGVAVGRRPERAIYQAGLWQLAPAGSVDPSATRPDGTIDVIRQTATELREELGVAFSDIDDAEPICVVEHAVSHVCDLGVKLGTSLRSDAIVEAHGRFGDAEYGSIQVVGRRDMEAFASRTGDRFARQSRLFLERLGWLAASFPVRCDTAGRS